MNKILTRIVGAVAGLAMAIGAGFAIGVNSNKQAKRVVADSSTTLTISTYASDNNWANGTAYNANYGGFDFEAIGGGNNGKYYTSDNTWRFYNGGGLSIQADSSHSTYKVTSVSSNPEVSFAISNGRASASFNATTKFSSITVNYTSDGPSTYSVTYHDTGKTSGSVPTDENEYTSGQQVTVLGNTGNLAKDGYVWSGWSLNEDGSGTAYGPTYTTTYTVGTNDVNFYPIWNEYVVPLPESGTISITATHPAIATSYGTDVPYVVAEDNTPYSQFGFNCTNVMKNGENLQFKASAGTLYSTTPLSYIRDIAVSGSGSIDAVITYGTSQNEGCTSDTVGTNNTYFKIFNGAGNARYWQITITYSLEEPAALTDLRIASGLDTVKKVYEEGETFDPTGLVIQAKWGDNWDTEHNVLNAVVWTPNPLTKGTVSVTGTYTSGDIEKTVTVTGLTVTGPDVTLNSSNKPFTSTSSSNTQVETKTLDGIEYQSYAAYVYNNYLCFNKSQSGAYLGNNTAFSKNIQKIVVNYNSGSSSYFTMYEGTSALVESNVISPSSHGTGKITYTFNDEYQFFKFKLTKTGNFSNINSISIYLGSTHIDYVITSVEASVNAGTYYVGSTLSASDFNVTVHWSDGKADTHPTEGFTWTVNGVANGTLAEGNNSVVLTYEGQSTAAFNVVGSVVPAKNIIENDVHTHASLAYSRYTDSSAIDSINLAYTDVSTNSYTPWSKDASNSNAVYAGKTAAGNSAIQLNNGNTQKPGIVTTKTGGNARKITVVWNDNTTEGRSFSVYGKYEAYTSVSNLYGDGIGTLIGTITYGTNTSLTFETKYPYIGIKANGALYLDSIEIEWDTFGYENLGIRFGGSISEELWNRLDTESDIQGYGVLLSTPEYLSGAELKTKYASADGTNVKKFTNDDTDHEPALKAEPTLKDGNYVWNLYKMISFANAAKNYVAVAFIEIDGDVVFLNEVTANMKDLARDLIDNDPNYNAQSFGGSLNYLADA